MLSISELLLLPYIFGLVTIVYNIVYNYILYRDRNRDDYSHYSVKQPILKMYQ